MELAAASRDDNESSPRRYADIRRVNILTGLSSRARTDAEAAVEYSSSEHLAGDLLQLGPSSIPSLLRSHLFRYSRSYRYSLPPRALPFPQSLINIHLQCSIPCPLPANCVLAVSTHRHRLFPVVGFSVAAFSPFSQLNPLWVLGIARVLVSVGISRSSAME